MGAREVQQTGARGSRQYERIELSEITLAVKPSKDGSDRVRPTAGAKDLKAKLRAAGFAVYDPDMSMYVQAGGGVHCMCQPLNREAGSTPRDPWSTRSRAG